MKFVWFFVSLFVAQCDDCAQPFSTTTTISTTTNSSSSNSNTNNNKKGRQGTEMTVFLYTLLIFAFFSWSFAPFTSPHPPFRDTTPAPPPLPTLKQIVRVVSQIIYFTLALFYFRAFFCLHCYRWVLLPLCNFFTRFYFLILFLFLFHLLLFCLPSLQLLFSLLLPIMRKINVLYRDQSQMKVCQGYGPQNYNCMGERLRLRLNVCVCLCVSEN